MQEVMNAGKENQKMRYVLFFQVQKGEWTKPVNKNHLGMSKDRGRAMAAGLIRGQLFLPSLLPAFLSTPLALNPNIGKWTLV